MVVVIASWAMTIAMRKGVMIVIGDDGEGRWCKRANW